tara:strand:+ start:527 stop:2653 length:2127 start_codon:yes stop_codon:yes gene_type:complete
MTTIKNYEEKVYAGVLGKIIGVYLGRPFEGWTYERIMEELGEIWYYVHEKCEKPLVVADDDIAGTLTFLRALPDYENTTDLTPAQIGQTWLNYLIEQRTILWWGGLGNSTEHTAFLRLKSGIEAPQSGSMALNSKLVAEQIGSQIFIDGWAMVAAGDPDLAVDFARRAASVSHDGEAIYGAQVVAAMEAQAFVESDLNKLIDVAIGFIPKDSIIYRVISDIREWHSKYEDWHNTRDKIAENYGYDKYGGNCHMVPNHALIMLGLLYSDDNFQQSLMITNTAGWDTDCNSGNVGCLMGIKNGISGIDAGPDWRGPVADRLYISSADSGRAITDMVTETYHIVNIGRALQNEAPLQPKDGARFHFELSGSVQGFQLEDSPECRDTVTLENVKGHSEQGARSLALKYKKISTGRSGRIASDTFIPEEAMGDSHYELLASPTLYSGQIVKAGISADPINLKPTQVQLFHRYYGAEDKLYIEYGPKAELSGGTYHEFEWEIPSTEGAPIAQIGVEISSEQPLDGIAYLDYLTWDGAPNVVFKRPADEGMMWRRAWVYGLDSPQVLRWPEAYRLIQNNGTGLLMQGTREWKDYCVTAEIKPHLVKSCGLAVRVQGMRRYYALLLKENNKACLLKVLDGNVILKEKDFIWDLGRNYELAFQIQGTRLQGWVDNQLIFDVEDTTRPLDGGGIALVCEEGRVATEAVIVQPARDFLA